jgi:hypothetical protein
MKQLVRLIRDNRDNRDLHHLLFDEFIDNKSMSNDFIKHKLQQSCLDSQEPSKLNVFRESLKNFFITKYSIEYYTHLIDIDHELKVKFIKSEKAREFCEILPEVMMMAIDMPESEPKMTAPYENDGSGTSQSAKSKKEIAKQSLMLATQVEESQKKRSEKLDSLLSKLFGCLVDEVELPFMHASSHPEFPSAVAVSLAGANLSVQFL